MFFLQRDLSHIDAATLAGASGGKPGSRTGAGLETGA